MLTGPDFQEEHVLGDGSPVTIRHVRPEDADELARGFEKLSPTSRYRRFLGGVTTLSPATLRYLTCVDGRNHVALVALTHGPGSNVERGLGIARFIRTADDPKVAEVAITVIDDAQRKGLGLILGVALGRAALERGITRFRGEVLTDNQPVRQLLDEVGATIRHAEGGAVVFEVDLEAAEAPAAPPRLELLARRVLRAASTQLMGLIRGLPAAAR
jgi:GNAT superfamily N-acetyltransferase